MKKHDIFNMLAVVLGILGILMFIGASLPDITGDHSNMLLAVAIAVFDWAMAVVFFAIADHLEQKERELKEGGNGGSQN